MSDATELAAKVGCRLAEMVYEPLRESYEMTMEHERQMSEKGIYRKAGEEDISLTEAAAGHDLPQRGYCHRFEDWWQRYGKLAFEPVVCSPEFHDLLEVIGIVHKPSGAPGMSDCGEISYSPKEDRFSDLDPDVWAGRSWLWERLQEQEATDDPA